MHRLCKSFAIRDCLMVCYTEFSVMHFQMKFKSILSYINTQKSENLSKFGPHAMAGHTEIGLILVRVQ
jgi:hypothetical protein